MLVDPKDVAEVFGSDSELVDTLLVDPKDVVVVFGSDSELEDTLLVDAGVWLESKVFSLDAGQHKTFCNTMHMAMNKTNTFILF